jgi:hypothetical protein
MGKTEDKTKPHTDDTTPSPAKVDLAINLTGYFFTIKVSELVITRLNREFERYKTMDDNGKKNFKISLSSLDKLTSRINDSLQDLHNFCGILNRQLSSK